MAFEDVEKVHVLGGFVHENVSASVGVHYEAAHPLVHYVVADGDAGLVGLIARIGLKRLPDVVAYGDTALVVSGRLRAEHDVEVVLRAVAVAYADAVAYLFGAAHSCQRPDAHVLRPQGVLVPRAKSDERVARRSAVLAARVQVRFEAGLAPQEDVLFSSIALEAGLKSHVHVVLSGVLRNGVVGLARND